jgi:transketolase
MFSAQQKLASLVLIIDNNGYQSDGISEDIINLNPLEDKFAAFEWEVFAADGHSIPELFDCFERIAGSALEKPKVLIANTIKGKGVSFMENAPAYHHARLSENLYKQALEELA